MVIKAENTKLSCNALNIGYSSANLLVENFEVDFQNGKFYALIGRNGSGKSTLLKHLAGLYKAIGGTISLNEQPMSKFSAQELARKICWIGTERIDYHFLTVWELVAMGRHPYLGLSGFLKNEDKAIIDASITKMGISHLSKKYLSQCSDGEKQSAMLARALSQETHIILLDEITAHLDYVHRHKTFDLLSKLARETNKIIVLATHEIDLSLKYCDEIMLLHNRSIQKIEAADFDNKDLLNEVFEGLIS